VPALAKPFAPAALIQEVERLLRSGR
jgi:hypothetical protein